MPAAIFSSNPVGCQSAGAHLLPPRTVRPMWPGPGPTWSSLQPRDCGKAHDVLTAQIEYRRRPGVVTGQGQQFDAQCGTPIRSAAMAIRLRSRQVICSTGSMPACTSRAEAARLGMVTCTGTSVTLTARLALSAAVPGPICPGTGGQFWGDFGGDYKLTGLQQGPLVGGLGVDGLTLMIRGDRRIMVKGRGCKAHLHYPAPANQSGLEARHHVPANQPSDWMARVTRPFMGANCQSLSNSGSLTIEPCYRKIRVCSWVNCQRFWVELPSWV